MMAATFGSRDRTPRKSCAKAGGLVVSLTAALMLAGDVGSCPLPVETFVVAPHAWRESGGHGRAQAMGTAWRLSHRQADD
jgi:hypothetical protein